MKQVEGWKKRTAKCKALSLPILTELVCTHLMWQKHTNSKMSCKTGVKKLTDCLAVMGAQPFYVCFMDLEMPYDQVPHGSCGGYCWRMVYLADCQKPSGPYIIKVTVVSIFSIKHIFIGCWTSPRLPLVSHSVCDIYGQDLKVHLRWSVSVRFGWNFLIWS